MIAGMSNQQLTYVKFVREGVTGEFFLQIFREIPQTFRPFPDAVQRNFCRNEAKFPQTKNLC